VGDLLATGLHRTELLLRPATAAERKRVALMLNRCGLTRFEKRRFLSLSYGQKRLALLARALVANPDWLLLDEFYNGLDTAYRRRIDRLLGEACAAGQSWIASAHRAMDVPRGTDGLIELRAGRLRKVSRLRADALARLAPAAPPVSPPRRRVGGGQWLVRLTGVDLYLEYRPVLRDVNWELRQGEHWAVYGANGAGKSSFLKLLYGDLSPALGGKIERRGLAAGEPIAQWKRRVGYVSPELQTDYGVDVTLLELVASGRYASIGMCDALTAADARAARRWLGFFKLASAAGRRPRELSYGQLRRALFARALAGEPRILLLDEPLTGLDPRQQAAMKRMLERLMAQGRTLVMAVHHAEDLPRGMTHSLLLHARRATGGSRPQQTNPSPASLESAN
jgi:molybdate transport system ATP-binding protein